MTAIPSDVERVYIDRITAHSFESRPAIHGGLQLHFAKADSPGELIRLVFPMAQALLLLNVLRQIERDYQLEDWSARIGTDPQRAAEIAQRASLLYPPPDSSEK